MGRKWGKGMGVKRKDVKGKAWWGKGGGEGNRSGRGNRMRVQEREGKLVKTGGCGGVWGKDITTQRERE